LSGGHSQPLDKRCKNQGKQKTSRDKEEIVIYG
jgi:hypothetical protein